MSNYIDSNCDIIKKHYRWQLWLLWTGGLEHPELLYHTYHERNLHPGQLLWETVSLLPYWVRMWWWWFWSLSCEPWVRLVCELPARHSLLGCSDWPCPWGAVESDRSLPRDPDPWRNACRNPWPEACSQSLQGDNIGDWKKYVGKLIQLCKQFNQWTAVNICALRGIYTWR